MQRRAVEHRLQYQRNWESKDRAEVATAIISRLTDYSSGYYVYLLLNEN